MDTSYWTKRRKISARVSEHIKFIRENEQVSTCQFENQSQNISHVFEHEVELNYAHQAVECEEDIDCSSERIDEIDVPEAPVIVGNQSDSNSVSQASDADDSEIDRETAQFELFLFDDLNCDNDSSDEEIICSGKEELFRQKLSEWASEFSIRHTALAVLLDLLREDYQFLPKDPRTLLKTARNVQEIAGGLYHHFGVSTSILQILETLLLTRTLDVEEIALQINIDGLPLFKSSSQQFWPILGRITIPLVTDPFIIGIFCGNSKPGNLDEYFHDFVEEMLELEANGMFVKMLNKRLPIRISCIICDAPARSLVKQIKGHSGYHGCDKCVQKGEWVGKMTFPTTDSPLRGNIQFDEMADENHHTGSSPLRVLSLGMVTQFPLDYMHLVCLGVMKRLLALWMRGPIANKCRIGANIVNLISEGLLVARNFLLREFLRKGRSLREVDRWKATEFRQFLLYTGPVVLLGKLSQDKYNHFLLFFVGIYCLSSESYVNTHCEYAKKIIILFVEQFGALYGRDMLVYNVHCLVHLADDVKLFGPLDNFSAFPFECFLGKLKKLVRQPKFPLQQVIRRLSERSEKDAAEKQHHVSLKKKHTYGPLTENVRNCTQYKELHYSEFCISIAQGNNCVRIGRHVALVRNIITDNASENIYLVYEQFTDASDFFTYPLDSSDLGIYIKYNK